MIKKVFAVSLIAASVAFAGCSSDDDDDGDAPVVTPPDTMMPVDVGNGNNLADALTNDTGDADGSSRFDTLLAAVTAADLGTTLGNVNNTFTVFAPTDAAFAALPEGALDALLADSAELNNTILYHVAARPEGFALAAGPLTAAAGGDLTIADVAPAEGETEGGFSVNENVLGAAIEAENGVIYPIDVVLTPVTMAPDMMEPDEGGDMTPPATGELGPVETAFAANADVSELFAAYNTAGFGGSLDGQGGDGTPNTWTVFAPSNAALTAAGVTGADVDADVLQRHIVTTASVPAADLAALTTITNNVGGEYPVAVDGDGNTTVNGFVVTEISTGQSTLYQIEGVLP